MPQNKTDPQKTTENPAGHTAEANHSITSLQREAMGIKSKLAGLFPSHYKNCADFFAGGAAGYGAGILVAPLETWKVHQQALHTSNTSASATTTGNLMQRFSAGSLASAIKKIPRAARNHFTPQLLGNMVRSIPHFSAMFAGVCALEFSVNAYVKQQHGKIAGFTASAITGAAFLSFADQMLYRRHLGQSTLEAIADIRQHGISRLFVGFQPMIIREFCFVTSMLGAGPAIAKYLHADDKTAPTELENWAGQIVSGVATNTFSHPWDAITRKMQIAFKAAPLVKQSFFKTTVDTFKNDRAFLARGLGPRLVLATYGAAAASAVYRHVRPWLEPEKNSAVTLDDVAPSLRK